MARMLLLSTPVLWGRIRQDRETDDAGKQEARTESREAKDSACQLRKRREAGCLGDESSLSPKASLLENVATPFPSPSEESPELGEKGVNGNCRKIIFFPELYKNFGCLFWQRNVELHFFFIYCRSFKEISL